VINPNDERFINPENMGEEIQAACRESNQPVPQSDAELARCIFDSLALLYADVLANWRPARSTFHPAAYRRRRLPEPLLNQLCADACGLPVIAGPIEASTLGNIGVQLMTLNELSSVDTFRDVVARVTR
jgi:rhamnulokinase